MPPSSSDTHTAPIAVGRAHQVRTSPVVITTGRAGDGATALPTSHPRLDRIRRAGIDIECAERGDDGPPARAMHAAQSQKSVATDEPSELDQLGRCVPRP